MPYFAFHRFGIERKRAETIRRVCQRATAIDRLAHEWVDAPTAGVRTAIESIPGIGPWSSAIVAQRAFGDPDAVIVGDYHLPNIVAFNLAGEIRGTDDRMLELLEPYRGQRGRVVQLLALGGRHAPRRGPGRRLRDIRRM
jgi:3-methyladenine DNA glycosylase/8-oxoguanine DNA glycosylase